MGWLRGALISLVPIALFAASFLHFSDTAKPPQAEPSGSAMSFEEVASVGNHSVPITVYRPLSATADHRVPVILHSHGWAGKRETDPAAFAKYTNASFGVISIDMRGHGEARLTSEARVDHVDYEIQDVRNVITYASGLPWVQLDAPGDPRIGAIGGSYGGGYQLLTAALDSRLDAIVPEITWNDLPQALVPNGAPKSAWVDLLYGGGKANARLHPTIDQAFAYLQVANKIPDGSVPGTPDIESQFIQSSPKTYPGKIAVPTLLVQGMPDTLFNFNQAAANYELVKATGAPVSLVTHLRGHILNTQGTIPIPAPTPIGLQPPTGRTPCGTYESLAIAWFQHYLQRKGGAPKPEVCLAIDDGTSISGPSFPLPATSARAYDFAAGSILAQGAAAPNVTFNVLTVDQESVIAGIPKLKGTAQSAAPDAIVYWKLVVKDTLGHERIADSQVTPWRLKGDPLATQSFAFDLGGVAIRLRAGDTLQLVASNADPQFAHNSEREPGAVILGAIHLELPFANTA